MNKVLTTTLFYRTILRKIQVKFIIKHLQINNIHTLTTYVRFLYPLRSHSFFHRFLFSTPHLHLKLINR